MSCVLTLALGDEAQGRFEALRRQYFPPARNVIPAHLTLFHTLPEDETTEQVLAQIAAQSRGFAMTVEAPRSIGRGVAFFLPSPEAVALHRTLSSRFDAHLSAQDRQGFRPHVVVQNKATPQTARETLALLQAAYLPWTAEAVGLDLWRYLDGPWQHLRRFDFAGA